MSDCTSTFCVLPWIHSFVNSNGNYQICCTAEEYHTGIPDSKNKNYNISKQPDPQEIMKAPFMNGVRKQMLTGKWPVACTRCQQTEAGGGVSRRQLENEKYKDLITEIKAETDDNGQVKLFKFKSIDYRLGNLCNLECRMCGPYSSNRWLKDWNKVKPLMEKMTPQRRKAYESYNWIDDPWLVEEFKSKIHEVDRLHFAGGEPLIAPQMGKLLDYCIEMGVADKITLSYNTNVTVLPEKILEKWKSFKEIRLLCSIDGFDKVNEYIRYPSKWKVIDQNLRFLDDNYTEYKIKELLISCTVQVYNVLFLDDLFDYLQTFKNAVPIPNLVNLYSPSYLRSTILPSSSKLIAKEKLAKKALELEKITPKRHQYLVANIWQIIHFMESQDTSSEIKRFYEFNSKTDDVKKISIKQYIPNLNEFLGLF